MSLFAPNAHRKLMTPTLTIHQACKNFVELEFFNPHFMSAGVQDTPNKKEIIVYLFKKIRTDNLPQEFEGYRVNYTYHGQVSVK